jgi:hypothetical protein
MLFIKIRGNRSEQLAPPVQHKIASEAHSAFQDLEAASVVGEVLKAVASEVVKAMPSKMMKMGGIGIRVRRAVMRGDDNHLRPGFADAVDFRHYAQDVRLVLEKMRKINATRAALGEGPWKHREVRQDVRRGSGLAIHADRDSFLLLFPASNVKDDHGERGLGCAGRRELLSVNPIVASAAFAALFRSEEHETSSLDTVAEANHRVGDFSLLIKAGDFHVKLAQDFIGAI